MAFIRVLAFPSSSAFPTVFNNRHRLSTSSGSAFGLSVPPRSRIMHSYLSLIKHRRHLHDLFNKHVEFKEFSNELHQAKTLSLCLGSNVVLIRQQFSFLAHSILVWFWRKIDFPSTLKLFLTSVEEILAKQLSARQRLAAF